MRGAIVGLLALGLVGCASGAPDIGHESRVDAPSQLELEIEPLTTGWVVHTTRPASVVLFEIVPGQGAGMLYPDPSREDGHLQAGSTRIVTEVGSVIARHRASYLTQRGGGGLVGSQNLELFEANDPTVVAAIACECELDVTQLAAPDGPARVLGNFAAVDTRSAAEQLARAVLPPGEDRWVMDRYAAGNR